MTQTFDAHQMLLDGVANATDTVQAAMFDGGAVDAPRATGSVYAYHILRRPGAPHWTARYHRMIFSDPIPAEEAVQKVAAGQSCYVERDGLETMIEQLAQLEITVTVDTPGTGKRSV